MSLPDTAEFFWPTEFHVVTQRYGANPNKFGYGPSGHEGIDLRAREGTKIFSCLSGIVSAIIIRGVYGNRVRVISDSINNSTVNSIRIEYCHLSRIDVPINRTIQRGELIGLAGSTGNVRGAHLHLNVFIDGKRVDPAPYLGV